MTDLDQTMEETAAGNASRQESWTRFKEFLLFLGKRLVVFISFGPGVLGLLWLIGRIFPKR